MGRQNTLETQAAVINLNMAKAFIAKYLQMQKTSFRHKRKIR